MIVPAWSLLFVCSKIFKFLLSWSKKRKTRKYCGAVNQKDAIAHDIAMINAFQEKIDVLLGKLKERADGIALKLESLSKQASEQEKIEFRLQQWAELMALRESKIRHKFLHLKVLDKIKEMRREIERIKKKMTNESDKKKGLMHRAALKFRKLELEGILSSGQKFLDSVAPDKIELALAHTNHYRLPEQERMFRMGGKLYDLLSGRVAASVSTGGLFLENGEKMLWRDTAELWLLRTHTNTIRRPKGNAFVDSFLWDVTAENMEDLAADSRVLSRSQRFNHFGNGILNCTDKRIIFSGETSTKTIKWKSIIKIECDYEGREILIHSTSFQKPVLFSDVDAEMFDLVQYCVRHPDDSVRMAHAPTTDVIAFLADTFSKGKSLVSIQDVKFLPPEH